MKQLLAALSALALAAACSAPAAITTAPAEAPEADKAASVETALPDTGAQVPRDGDGRPLEYLLLGQKLPAFTAPMADGSTFDSAKLDRWTVISIWSAACRDSVADGPFVSALDRAIAQDPDLDFVSIHVPLSPEEAEADRYFGDHDSLGAYFASAGYTLPVILDANGSVREQLKISWTPTYLLISPDGIVRAFRTDLSVDKDQPVKTYIKNVSEVRKDVRDLLASDPSDLE